MKTNPISFAHRLGIVLWSVALPLVGAHAQGTDLPYVNFESHPIHALDLSPSGQILALAHTADQRVQLFDVRQGEPVAMGHVVVGLDPVSVRFRTESELWVVNHISDSVSVIDLPTRRVRAVLATPDEPFDVVFANGKAFVSASQTNQVAVFELADLSRAPTLITLKGEDPRALAVSANGAQVYAAIFESGNATTVLSGGLERNESNLPNTVSDPRGPYGGVNPPPNKDSSFEPPINAAAPRPPAVGLIVRKGADKRWRDDNARDWTDFVSGNLASASGRRIGWDLPDRDLAVIDSSSLSVSYVSGLMNINMALAVQPGTGAVTVVGTEAFNEVRFEPNVQSRFIEVRLAKVQLGSNTPPSLLDLNSHLPAGARLVPQAQRERSLGDPRAIVWNGDGSRAWVAGMGSNNVIELDRDGRRTGVVIRVGEGPAAMAFHSSTNRLFVWNHFAAELSTLDVSRGSELKRLSLLNPLPASVRLGRKFLYDTQLTSGLGQVACASCHVDARIDRLAWDLGDPRELPKRFDQNCLTTAAVLLRRPVCEDFHGMKGPMTTQTMQDIIGHEPLHWRGDRSGIEQFNPAFVGLLGDDRELTASEMQSFENFLSSIHFPPNPFRNLDNTLPSNMALPGHTSAGRFSMAGVQLPNGNAQRGLNLYVGGVLDNPFECSSCHTLPTGMAANGPLRLSQFNLTTGGSVMPTGPMGENHLGIVSVDGSTNVSMKVPQLRNQYDKTGMDFNQLENLSGFGFLHDGSVDTLVRFFSANAFNPRSDQDLADIVALSLAFSGSDFGVNNPNLSVPPPLSKDSHAGVGQQLLVQGSQAASNARALSFVTLAKSNKVDLVIHSGSQAWAYDSRVDRFVPSDGSSNQSLDSVFAKANSQAQVWTLVPKSLGTRLALDRDGDGLSDGVELKRGSDPALAQSTEAKARAGLWYNPVRSGHGFDVQHAGANMLVIWYSYLADGRPTWYLASGPRSNPWRAELEQFTWDGVRAQGNKVGSLLLSDVSATRMQVEWTLSGQSGREQIQWLAESSGQPLPDRTGTWFDASEPGYGLSINSIGPERVVVLYFYDRFGQPTWALGQGSNESAASISMQSFRGFCPGCAVVPLRAAAAGSVELNFSPGASLSTAVFAEGENSTPWRRTARAITPLSEAAVWLEAK